MTNAEQPSRSRVGTLPLWGFAAIVVVYLGVLQGLPLLTGNSHDHPYGEFDTQTTLLRIMTIPVLASVAIVAIAISVLRWWPRVIHDHRPVQRWVWSIAIVMLAAVLISTNYGNLADVGLTFTMLALGSSLLVGIGEELMFRGIGIAALRDTGLNEVRVGLWSSAIFGAAHITNIITEGPSAFVQVVVVSMLGYAFYLLRRASGTIIVPIVAHGLWDFSQFSSRIGTDQGVYIASLASLAGTIVIIALMFFRRNQIEIRNDEGSVVTEWADVHPVATDLADPDTEQHRVRRTFVWIGRGLAVIVLVVLLAAVIPVSSSNLDANADPALSYDEAITRYEATRAAADTDADIFEPCHSQLMTHGERTEVAVVLFHGLTNCPKQFIEFGQHLFDEGQNVLILRAPFHGLSDDDGATIGAVSNVGPLSAQDLRDWGDQSIDIATGLGQEVRVTGLSMGGVESMWAAQFRDDVDRVVVVAPAISIPGLPHFVTTAFINLFNRLPNFSIPTSGTELDHTSAGESTGALSAMMLLARANENELTTGPAAADEIVVVLNPNDDQVDNDEVIQLVERWDDADGHVPVVMLPDIGLPHDVIDEDQPAGNTDVVYPILFALLDGEQP